MGREAGASRLAALLPVAGMVVFQATSIMTAVAVPSILADFGLGVEWSRWIITAYLVPMAIMMVTWGAAGDLFGRWRIYRLGLTVFGLGTLISATANSLPWLVAGQALQATGAAALHPIGTALVAESVPPAQRGRALSRLRLFFSLAAIGSAPLGGLLIQLAGWHSIYVIGPVIVVTLLLASTRLPAERRATTVAVRFDVIGTVILVASLGALLIALLLGPSLGWTSPPILLLTAIAVVGLMVFIPIERRQAQPIIPPVLLHHRGYAAMIAAAFIHAMPYFGTYQLAPVLVQSGFGMGPAQGGLLLMAYPIGQALSGLIAGRLVDRYGSPTICLSGLGGTLIGIGLLVVACFGGGLAFFLPGALIIATSTGTLLIGMTIYTVDVCGAHYRARGSGLYTMVTYIGESISTSLFPLLLAGRIGASLIDAFGSIYLIAGLLTILALPPILLMRQRSAGPVLAATAPGDGD